MPFETLVRTRFTIHMYLILGNLLCNTDLSGIVSGRVLDRNANLHPLKSCSIYYGLKSAINNAIRNHYLLLLNLKKSEFSTPFKRNVANHFFSNSY